jgi:hypothetical protein
MDLRPGVSDRLQEEWVRLPAGYPGNLGKYPVPTPPPQDGAAIRLVGYEGAEMATSALCRTQAPSAIRRAVIAPIASSIEITSAR